MEKKQPIIELKHIKKCYTKDVPVIYDFNLTINEGEFVTFLGPSGCGKTTILRMLAGFETPTSGEILFNGKDISELPPNERKFNTVFQKYALFPHLNIYDNISFGLKEKKVPKNEIKKR
ncbi:spermidine/putrescine transport system ATP-binding protein [Lachnospiraceae bacterium 5_1_63FAA]|nr:spermidine/putrescine transport system ATP-binding protein [Lachnospiraceae bacterium 5_1_63FAA]